ncbi:hypothetical protein QBC36DRAFT_332641 [Triangularia setosa]|uniref:FAD-binding PCMH-type domain-containing protein n=1 Tax=Triangularia setosa TaxID=2587417 RepID=A0AAN7A4B0_9PEZI|nr:hypothetical protein QBC36DRAFT_332641 [Podospora setosa]
MATLDTLKRALLQKASATTSTQKQPLSDEQYRVGLDIFLQSSGWMTYQDFIVPQLIQLLGPLFQSRLRISVLEIGPGPKSVLGHLLDDQKQKITKYTAFEPNKVFASKLKEWLHSNPFPCLEHAASINLSAFTSRFDLYKKPNPDDERFDVILFCHSMYGMTHKHEYIIKTVNMLVEQPGGGMVVVFHRDGLRIEGVVAHRVTSFPTGIVSIVDTDKDLDRFAQFIAGFSAQDESLRALWRSVCRDLGRHDTAQPGNLLFSAPEIMVVFTRNATAWRLSAPLMKENRKVKNREAHLRLPCGIVQPTGIVDVQDCTGWALENKTGLTVMGGGHSGHCLWSNIRAIDMGTLNKAHVIASGDTKPGPLIVVESGCRAGDIIRKALADGLTVPLGARPSVGAGLWLQGGIGHLSRLHGLACDAIVGAVVVSVESGKVLSVGYVPDQHRPHDAVPLEDNDLLWAIKGAGTNFGIITSITFKAYPTPTYTVQNWVLSFNDMATAKAKIGEFDNLIAKGLPRSCSADAYLFWNKDRLHLGITMFETSMATNCVTSVALTRAYKILGPGKSIQIVDSMSVFDTEMYMSEMHGGHGGGKTSSFKRCLFLKDIGESKIATILLKAIENRPTPLCYLHLLQGGGAIGDVPADATAFGCRDWDFACVITGVWPREQDGTKEETAAVRWVYQISGILLPLSTGVYGADLGPDPRDAALAVKAFGPNLMRLARLKKRWDPCNVLAYACPLPAPPKDPKVIVLVTGESGAGKDFCAGIWACLFTKSNITASVSSISEVTKCEYALATGADLNRLLNDRTYREQHREALTAFFQSQVEKRPQLPEKHFLNVVHSATDIEVLFITGMRDKAPVATFSHLVPDTKLVEVRIETGSEVRRVRRGLKPAKDTLKDKNYAPQDEKDSLRDKHDALKDGENALDEWDYSPSFVFHNDDEGGLPARSFFQRQLLPLFHPLFQQLAGMVRQIPDFPKLDINFRHVLGISQSRGGLKLCTSLLRAHCTSDWTQISSIVCVETGGFIFASALALQVDVPLALTRENGKLPPPVVSVVKDTSHISGVTGQDQGEKTIEMEVGVIPKGGKVVVIDDVLATGKTLCAVLKLLIKAGVARNDISAMVVAEFPFHKGRELLYREGFGGVNVQSLLVVGGV